MSPDELVGALKKRFGTDVSRPTLNRWVKLGLIPAPATGSAGRGQGRWSDYPPAAINEAYVTGILLEFGAKLGVLAEARSELYRLARGKRNPTPLDTLSEMTLRTWAILAARAAAGVKGRTPILVRLDGLDEDGCLRWRVEEAERTDFLA